MKNKIKKWHIVLMSFVALMLAIFTSLFNLKADPVDDETGEILLDNWELGVVFYDSTVNNGKTPLNEINWDASDGSYKEGTSRVITVQINYKNTNAVTTYQPGELEIGIPNLIYTMTNYNETAYAAQWTTSVIVGANDATHTGYDWTFVSGDSPTSSQSHYYFANAEIIEEKSNFEGSIQIQYTITPKSEYPEYTEECIHSFSKTLKASLGKAGKRIITEKKFTNTGIEITSPNWPNNYTSSINNVVCGEYTDPNAESLKIYFDPSSYTEPIYDKIYIYDKTGTCKHTLSGSSMAGKVYEVEGNYIKVVFYSDYSTNAKGFQAYIGSGELELITTTPENLFYSSEINFNYTRTYTHPWQKPVYSITKKAYRLSSLDGLPQGDYYWIKYEFKVTPDISFSRQDYPYIRSDYYITDNFPEDVVVVDSAFNQLFLEDGCYYDDNFIQNGYYNTSSHYEYLYVGYPKSIYNEAAGTLTVTNHVDLYVKHKNETEYAFADDDEITFNLIDFEFTYSGDLYGFSKTSSYSQYSYQFYQNLTGERTNIGLKGAQTWILNVTSKYVGKNYDVKIGDDLLYITRNDGTIGRLDDSEYYFSRIVFPSNLRNGNEQIIANEKYNCELWVRYANQNEYVKYEEFLNKGKTWNFTKTQAVVGYYFIIKNLSESIIMNNNSYCFQNSTVINNAKNISQTGNFYNFGYLQVYIDGILQNQPELNSYATFLTQLAIATYDQNTYGTYMQRGYAQTNYRFFELFELETPIDLTKSMSEFAQDAINEKFTGRANLRITQWKAPADIGFGYGSGGNLSFTASDYLYFAGETLPEEQGLKGWEVIDLLPEGMILTSSEEDILNDMAIQLVNISYLADKTSLTSSQFVNLIKENTSVTITENWNGTGRTRIRILVDLTSSPIFSLAFAYGNNGGNYVAQYYYNYEVSYDSFLEYGPVWENTGQLFYYGNKLSDFLLSSTVDKDDINNDNDIVEFYSSSKDSKKITSIISTHQDVTKYVKTDKNNYSTGTVDASCNSEYEYKLRVRTGAADVTNLIIYDILETAQPERTRWKGEFLGVDTSYAENKTYQLYKPEDPNADANGYISYKINIKIYSSEDSQPGNLYNENGELNSKWKEYNESITDKTKVKALAFEYLDSNGNSVIIPESTLTYVTIQMKSPYDENIRTLARNDCYTQWNALDDYGQPVDFITGINSNVVKVALPNSVDEDSNPSISLRFIKEIQGTDSEFENMKLDKAAQQLFMIKLTDLTANEDGSYNQIAALLKSDQELIISRIPVGTYLLEELGDNYFDFVEFAENNEEDIIIEGVTFERTDQGYIITVSEDLTENIEFNIKVTNEIEPERFYEDKENKENIFLKTRLIENN